MRFALYTVTGGTDDSDGGLHTENQMAEQAGMSSSEFSDAIATIEVGLDEIAAERNSQHT